MLRPTAVVLVAALLLAGCAEEGTGAKVSPRTVPDDAAAAGGSGTAEVVVRVTDGPRGPPVPGAKVVVSTTRDDVVPLVADGDGVATARVGANARATVAATAEDRTEEFLYGVVVGAPAATTRVEVPLYREHLVVDLDGTLTAAGGSGHRAGVGGFDWRPVPVVWSQDAETQAGYAARVVWLNSTLDWTNGPTAAGDLGLGVGRDASAPDLVEDGDDAITPGDRSERLSLDVYRMYDLGWQGATQVFVGPGTGTAYAAPVGLPFALEVAAFFTSERPLDAPNALMGALAALAVAAFVARRR